MSTDKRFTDIYSNIGTEVRDTSSAFQTIAKRYANDGYMEIVKRLQQAELFETYRTHTFTTTANTRTYPLPYDFGDVVYIKDSTNNLELGVMDEREFIQNYCSAINTTGNPFMCVVRAESAVMVQPTSSTKVSFVSSSGSDTSQSGFIRGISGSAEFYETVSLNGTTTAQTSNSYDYILQAQKSAVTVGAVTLTYVTGSGTASIMSPETTTQRYKVLDLYFVPSATLTIDVRFKREVRPMTQDSDAPIIDVSEGIEMYGIARAWEYKRQFANAAHFRQVYEMWLDKYITQRMGNRSLQFDITPYPRSDTYNTSGNFSRGYND